MQVFFPRYYGFIALEMEFLTWPFEEAFYRLVYQTEMRVISFVVMNDVSTKHLNYGNGKVDCATSVRQDNLHITDDVYCVLMEEQDFDECVSTNGC